jgi:putative GTP pyrophosphokinase
MTTKSTSISQSPAQDEKSPTDSSSAFELSEEQAARILRSYEELLPRNNALLDEVVFILGERIRASEIKIHAIEKRIKDIGSTLNKCKKKKVTDLRALSDVVGARVICLFRSDMGLVGKLIAENFEVLDVDDKIAVENNPLGYLSVHYKCKMPTRYKGPRYENTSGLEFEIQVRTLCMHAWAAVSHYLDYKGDWDVPAELKRALSALGGLFYVADSEFEQFSAARANSRRQAELAPDPIAESEINLDTMAAYLRAKFPTRKQPDSDAVSELVQQIKQSGYSSIKAVDRDVSRALDGMAAFEKGELRKGQKLNSVGVVRISLSLVCEEMRKRRRDPDAKGDDTVLNYTHLVKD